MEAETFQNCEKNTAENSQKELQATGNQNTCVHHSNIRVSPGHVVKCPRRTGTSNLDLLLHLKTLTEVLTHLKLRVVAGYTIIFTDVLILSVTFYLASQPRLHRSRPAKDSVRYRGLLPSHKLPLHCSHFISLLNRALYII